MACDMNATPAPVNDTTALLGDIARRLLIIETLAREQAERLARPDDDKLLDDRELAQRLGIEPRTVRQWRAQGMPHRRISKRSVRHLWSEVLQWVANQPGH